MFDCVMPTRSGRHGQAFTRFGKVNLRNARHAADPRPLDPQSPCPALSRYSRAYLHHLVKSGELLGMMLLSWANIAYYQELMQGVHVVVMLAEPVVMLRHQLIEGCLGRDKRVLGALQRVHTFGMVIKMLAIAAHGAVMQELGTLQQRQAVEVV